MAVSCRAMSSHRALATLGSWLRSGFQVRPSRWPTGFAHPGLHFKLRRVESLEEVLMRVGLQRSASVSARGAGAAWQTLFGEDSIAPAMFCRLTNFLAKAREDHDRILADG